MNYWFTTTVVSTVLQQHLLIQNRCFSDFVTLSRPLVFVQLLSPSLRFLFSFSFAICFSRENQLWCCLLFALPEKVKGQVESFPSLWLCDPLQPQSQPWPWVTAGCCHFTPATFLWICSWPLWGFQHTVYMTFLPALTLPAISYVLPFHEFMIIEQTPPPSKWAVGEIWSFM